MEGGPQGLMGEPRLSFRPIEPIIERRHIPMRRTKPLHLVLFLAAAVGARAFGQQSTSPTASAQASAAKQSLDRGVELFGQEKYRDALDLFGQVMSDPKAIAERPEAAYWSVLAYLASGDQATAETSIDAFVAAYPSSPRVPDLLYQRGRILYSKGDYEGALKVFAAFSAQAPSSDLIPSALYWSGECLYALGRLEEAERTFTAVTQNYPQSVKVEAATYRLSLIGLEYRQRELLKLLTWSHEEALRAAEDYRRREKAYESSIALYQKQIADSKRGAASDQDKTIADLRAQVADLGARLEASEANLASSQAEVDSLKASLAAAQAAASLQAAAPAPQAPQAQPAVPMAPDARSAALDAKERALDLLDFYIDRLTNAQPKDGSK
jgi:TolA-binding protein